MVLAPWNNTFSQTNEPTLPQKITPGRRKGIPNWPLLAIALEPDTHNALPPVNSRCKIVHHTIHTQHGTQTLHKEDCSVFSDHPRIRHNTLLFDRLFMQLGISNNGPCSSGFSSKEDPPFSRLSRFYPPSPSERLRFAVPDRQFLQPYQSKEASENRSLIITSANQRRRN